MIETTMTVAAWSTLLFTFAVAVVMPGPDSFLILRLGIRDRRAALLASCGIMAGNAVWTSASVLGLAALLRALPAAMPLLQTVGSLALIWMGLQSIRGGIATLRRPKGEDGARVEPGSVTERPFRLGVITNLSNPKALLFFTALFAQLMPPNASGFDRLIVLIAFTIIGLAWFFAFSYMVSSRSFQRWFGRATPYIDIAAGVVFLLVAGFVLVELALTWVF